MRKLVTVLFALGLLLGVAGSALAECGGAHPGTGGPTPEQPKPQV